MELEDKIRLIMQQKSLSPSQFADEIGVPRSGISHILAGRNRPSLDVVQKIMKRYPELGTNWILEGEKLPRETPVPTSTERAAYEAKPPLKPAPGKPLDLFSQPEDVSRPVQTNLGPIKKAAPLPAASGPAHPLKKIERVLVFYTDGTFREYVEA